jgi:diguanylate cyclase (GGDEF)-like protein
LSQLDRALSRLERHPTGLAIAFIDLDNFKAINDSLGHGCGDKVLLTMAVLLASQVRPGDSIARFGGDEFVALFEDLSQPVEQATELAQRLFRAARQPIDVVGEAISMTASIGVAVVAGPHCRSEDVLARADATMYSVKHGGRNSVAVAEL